MVLAALFAVLSSVSFGVSDVLTGAALRRHNTAALTLVGTADRARRRRDGRRRATRGVPAGPGCGVAAGALGALAVLAFYTALQRGSTSVVAPVAACGVLIPVLAGLLQGQDIGWRAGAGPWRRSSASWSSAAPGKGEPSPARPRSAAGRRPGSV